MWVGGVGNAALTAVWLKVVWWWLLGPLIRTDVALALRIVQVTIPSAVPTGHNATLICEHDTEGDTLYSVKWYKGRREFFRYTPKEIPAVKLFSMHGISVDQEVTNATQIRLKNVTPKISGKYSCEVSADAPSFQTSIVSGEMEVVVIPAVDPMITGTKPFYAVGEMLKANCTLNGSIPSALLEWKINNYPVHPSDIIKYDITKEATTKLQSRTIGLNFLLSQSYFEKGKLVLKCAGHIHDLYYGEMDVHLEEDRQQVHSPSLSYLSDEVSQRNAASALHRGPSMANWLFVWWPFGAAPTDAPLFGQTAQSNYAHTLSAFVRLVLIVATPALLNHVL